MALAIVEAENNLISVGVEASTFKAFEIERALSVTVVVP